MGAPSLFRSLFPTLLLLAIGVVTICFFLFRSSVLSQLEAEYSRELLSKLQLTIVSVESEDELKQALSSLEQTYDYSLVVLRDSGETFFQSTESTFTDPSLEPLPSSERPTRIVGPTDKDSLPYLTVRSDLPSFALTVFITAPVPALMQIERSLNNSGLIALLFALFLSVSFTAFVIAPLKRALTFFSRAVQRFGAQSSVVLSRLSAPKELQELAVQFERSSLEVTRQMQAILTEKNETDAVLASMAEGVIAIDSSERILRMNRAAMEVFHLELHPKMHPSVQEAIRNTDFLRLVKKVLVSHHPIEGEITLIQESEKILHVNATPLRNPEAELIGALLVFHDVTNLRKLETMRRDFVANVSHELKTPITSIKGFVETLLDGAMDNPEDTRRFLEIVLKQSDRLTSIIDDLLSLSRLESDQKSSISFEPTDIAEVIQRACQTCEREASEKKIQLKVDAFHGLHIRANSHLLEQAIINLLSNAIKYSYEEGEVIVRANVDQYEVRIAVEDFGIGIPKIHIPRLFERFYRVDKARSRKMGGTGLGLAITKHIAQVHSGYVSVRSSPGQGSTFVLHVPFEPALPRQANA